MWLTKHARERMVEREISEEEVFAIFADSNFISYDSNKDKTVVAVIGKVGERILVAIYNTATKGIITVRTANRKERKMYDIRFEL
ncbi:MAG: DUF4258 domain-containing protein [Chitinispirillales bacterium]|jgi:uncharacterized DUF497 family protein|nr:DUF4258 domain-containing protein [Chitinispirillales bacterium]